jgi:hypothetical protein
LHVAHWDAVALLAFADIRLTLYNRAMWTPGAMHQFPVSTASLYPPFMPFAAFLIDIVMA